MKLQLLNKDKNPFRILETERKMDPNTDWGWKKRSFDDDSDDDVNAVDDETEVEKRSKYSNNYYIPYKYRQPHSLASTSYRWVRQRVRR